MKNCELYASLRHLRHKKIEILLLNGGKVVRENLRGENESIT